MKSFRLIMICCLLCGKANGQIPLEAFTHPEANIQQSVSIYHSPNNYFSEISSDDEAGWIVHIHERQGNFFRVDIEDLNMNNVWIHCGDLGVVIQNYDNANIPLFPSISKECCDTIFLTHNCFAIVYDLVGQFVFVRVEDGDKTLYGWIEKRYLCGSPYTTCP